MRKPITLPSEHGLLDLVFVYESNGRECVVAMASGLIDRIEANTPILLRVQSSCLFSESLGTTDCDCALQLSTALSMTRSESCVVAHVREEGRGAGLRRKFAAIAEQQASGSDTKQAYEKLGFQPEMRTEYRFLGAAFHELFGRSREYILLTNNPHKVDLMLTAGLVIRGTKPLICTPDAERARYLDEKRRVLGHKIG